MMCTCVGVLVNVSLPVDRSVARFSTFKHPLLAAIDKLNIAHPIFTYIYV